MCCHDKHRTDAVDYSLPSFTFMSFKWTDFSLSRDVGCDYCRCSKHDPISGGAILWPMKSFGSIALLNIFCIFIFLFSYIILSTFNLIERLN